MAIEFKRKEIWQKYLLFLFVVLLIVIPGLYLIKRRKNVPPSPVANLPQTKIEIDFSIFNNPLFKLLKPVQAIPPFQKEIKRDNPFLPYKGSLEEATSTTH